MGWDADRIVEQNTNTLSLEELVCSICRGIIDEPTQAPCRGKHSFCKNCITLWLTDNVTCPMDRQPIYQWPH